MEIEISKGSLFNTPMLIELMVNIKVKPLFNLTDPKTQMKTVNQIKMIIYYLIRICDECLARTIAKQFVFNSRALYYHSFITFLTWKHIF